MEKNNISFILMEREEREEKVDEILSFHGLTGEEYEQVFSAFTPYFER